MNDAATPAPRADGHAARRRGTRAQVIEAAYNRDGDWEFTAQAARDFLALKEPLPPFVIDHDNDKWVLNDKGAYDCLDVVGSVCRNKTLDYIRDNFGIQED